MGLSLCTQEGGFSYFFVLSPHVKNIHFLHFYRINTHTHTHISYICKLLSHVQLFATPWTATHQAPLSMGFSRQEYWSGLTGPPPGDLPNPGIKSDLLHWRQILYYLSHQESPLNRAIMYVKKKKRYNEWERDIHILCWFFFSGEPGVKHCLILFGSQVNSRLADTSLSQICNCWDPLLGQFSLKCL